jgi:hypothetical protein
MTTISHQAYVTPYAMPGFTRGGPASRLQECVQEDATMQITELDALGPTLFAGKATSTRGRYRFLVDANDGEVFGVFREHPGDLWRQVTPPKALTAAARQAARQEIRPASKNGPAL